METAREATRKPERRDREPGRGFGPTPAPAETHPLLTLQQQAGNQAVQAFLRQAGIHPKLAISQPDDPAEREADQVADRIMRMHAGAPASSGCSCAEGSDMCEECQQKQQAVVSRSATNVIHRQSTNTQPAPQINQPTNPQTGPSGPTLQPWDPSLISSGILQTEAPNCYGESGGWGGQGAKQTVVPGQFSQLCSHPCAYRPLPLRVMFHTDGTGIPRPGVNLGDKVSAVSATVKFEPSGGGQEIVLLKNQGDATYVAPGYPLQTTFNQFLNNFTLPGPGQLIVSLINSDRWAGQGLGVYSDTIQVDACPGVAKPSLPVPSTSVQLGKWLEVPDPINAPLQYTVVDKNTPVNGPGVIVQVEKDDKGYFYRYNGRRIDLPGNPPYPGAQVQPNKVQPNQN